MNRDQDSDLNYEMVHKTVQAATAPRIETTGVASVFALGESLRPEPEPEPEPASDREPDQPRREHPKSRRTAAKLLFIEHGQMLSGELAQRMGITQKAATQLCYNMTQDKALRVVRKSGLGCLYDLPELPKPKSVKAKPAAAQPTPPATAVPPSAAPGFRVALFNTGDLVIECGGRTMQLAQADTKALCEYLDRVLAD